MSIHRSITIGAILTSILFVTPNIVMAQETPESSPEAKPIEVVQTNGEIKLKLNFQDMPLQSVMEYLSETAGLTVLSDEPLSNGRVTVISRKAISITEAVSLINSILKENGLTTVLTGKTLKVVTLANAKLEQLPVLSGRDPDAVEASDDVVTYVVPLAHLTAANLLTNLSSMIPEYASIAANEDGNALIITDTTSNIRRLMQIIKALDTHMSSVTEIRVFPLVYADATSAATLINNIFSQDQTGTSRNRNRGPGGGRFEMMMGGRGGRGGPGGDNNQNAQTSTGVNTQVIAAADDRTNSVVVRGPSEALNVVETMLKALDDRTVQVADVRIFQLRYADALNTAEMLNQLFGDQSSSSSQQGGPMAFMRGGPGGRGMQQQDSEEGSSSLKVTAAADSQTNTIVVTGPTSVLDVIEDVIKKIDSQIPQTADVKVFHLEYADAQNTAELINDVFGQNSTSSSRSSSRNSQRNQQVMFRGMGGSGMQMGSTSTNSFSDIEVVASADSRTNSVVVSGPPETLEIISNVIKQLDENPEQERQIFVYPLKNATASNLMEILNNLFSQMQELNDASTSRTGQQFQGAQRGATTQGTDSSSSDDLSEETYFEADEETNSLLILTSTKNYKKIEPIIMELDKPLPQVLIKVLFAEVTHSNSVDLGTEFSMLNLRTSTPGGSTETTTTFGQPTSGLSVNTIQGDIDFTIRALQETGRLNVLSRPYILTSNNQLATITVGEEVPIPTGSTTVAGQTQTTVEYRDDIGIVLNVTPSINPEGLVIMDVNPQITTRSAETVAISETLNAEAFSTRSAETKVAIRNGQTIVIGGLIEDQIKDTIKKVPFAGDIPLVGHLFKRTIKEKTKTELLIFLTPIVAEDADKLLPISNAERARSKLSKEKDTSELFKEHMEGMEGDTKMYELQGVEHSYTP